MGAKPGGRGRGIPTGGCSLRPREYHDPPAPIQGEIWRQGQGGFGIPAVLGGVRGIPVAREGGRSLYSCGSAGGAALPVGIPRPRPPGLAASLRFC